ncbi:MAG: nucleotidyltransferase family protein [Bacteroidetes bacterium]|jgi:molybdenum cofactor cytidylyltransferase|nr:nucleotidyltransferase family protein [Bacteroidota bacterium]
MISIGGLWGLILAAGESKRMGFPKMLLTFNGRTMIENVIGNVIRSDVDNTMVVLGADRDTLIELVEKSPVKYCYNDNYKEGMLSSVKCGFRNLPSDFEAVLVFQGDQPLIFPKAINTVIEAYRHSGKGIVIPVYKNKRGHPLLIDRKYRNEIEKLDAHEGLRSLAYQFSDDVLEVETDNSDILRDFDTYEDYKKEINQIQ